MPSSARERQAPCGLSASFVRRLLCSARGGSCVASDNLNVFGCPRGHNREAGERPARYRHCKCEALPQKPLHLHLEIREGGMRRCSEAAERTSQETCPKPTARKSHVLQFAALRCGSHRQCRFYR